MPQDAARNATRIAYIMSRFPKLSETFVLYEILAMESLGAQVEIFPLLRERQRTAHPEALQLCERAHFTPFISIAILRSNAAIFFRHPLRYLRTLGEVLWQALGSLNFLVGAAGIFPKAVHFARKMRAMRIDHVHAHFANHPTVAALIIHRLTGIPFSFTAHGSDLHVERRMLGRKIEAAAFAVTVSEHNRQIMLKECGPECAEKVAVLHCGIDRGIFNGASGRVRHESPFRILCVASFEEVKGHRFLVEACRILAHRGLDFVCHMVGEGPLRLRVQEQVRLAGLQQRVHLLDARPRPEIARMLRQADVFVLASHPTASGKREGIPVALMEAMGSGLPVVASATGGIPELVRHHRTGLLVRPGDVTSLADAIAALYESPAARRWLAAGAQKLVKTEFDLKTNAARLLAMIREVQTRRTVASESVGLRQGPAIRSTAQIRAEKHPSGVRV